MANVKFDPDKSRISSLTVDDDILLSTATGLKRILRDDLKTEMGGVAGPGVIDIAALVSINNASILNGETRAVKEGGTLYKFFPTMTPAEAAIFTGVEEPFDKPSPGVGNGYWVPEQGGSGIYETPSGTLADYVTAAGTDEKPLAIDQEYTLTSGTLTIPKNIDITVVGAGKINVSAGAQLYIEGDFKAPRDKQVFTGTFATGEVIFREGSVEKINARWFGAAPDAYTSGADGILTTSGTDSSPAVAKAHSAGDDQIPTYLPGGKIESGVDVGKIGYYKFLTRVILGTPGTFKQAQIYGDPGGGSFRTRIFADMTSGSPLALQSTRGGKIKDILISGKNVAGRSLAFNQYKTVLDWVSPGIDDGVLDPKTAYSGIEIDPDNMAVGSADTEIENVKIVNFHVAINTSSGGQVQGDTLTIKNAQTDYNTFFLSLGNSQNRTVTVFGGNIKRGNTLFTNNRFGAQQGAGVRFISTQVTSHYQFLDATTAFGENIVFNGVYSEQMGRFGKCLGGVNQNTVSVRDTHIETAPDIYESETKWFEGQTSLLWVGGKIASDDRNLWLVDNDRSTVFRNVQFRHNGAEFPEVLPHTVANNGLIDFDNCWRTNNATQEELTSTINIDAADADTVQDVRWYHQQLKINGSSQKGTAYSIRRKRNVSTTGAISATSWAAGVVTYTFFNASDVHIYSVGDVINGKDVEGNVLPCLEITNVDIGNLQVSAKKIWHSLQEAVDVGNAQGYPVQNITTQKKHGVVTKNSDLVQGVAAADTLFTVGQVWPIEGFNASTNPYIISFPDSATIQLSDTALFDVPKAEIQDASIWDSTEPTVNLIPNYVDQRIRAIGQRKQAVWTFDDGYKNIILNAVPLLRRFGHRATVYHETENTSRTGLGAPPDRDYLEPDDLRFLIDNGWEIGLHFFADPVDTEQILWDDANTQISLLIDILTGAQVPTGTGSFNPGPVTHPQYANYKIRSMSYRGGTRSAKTDKVMRTLFDSIRGVPGLIDDRGMFEKYIHPDRGADQIIIGELIDTSEKTLDEVITHIGGTATSQNIPIYYGHGVVDGNTDPSSYSFPAINEVQLEKVCRYAFDNNVQFVPVNYAHKGSVTDDPESSADQFTTFEIGTGNTVTVDAVTTYLGRPEAMRIHCDNAVASNNHGFRTKPFPADPWTRYKVRFKYHIPINLAGVGDTQEGLNVFMQSSEGNTSNTTHGSDQLRDQLLNQNHTLFVDGLPNLATSGWQEVEFEFVNTAGTQADIRFTMYGVTGDVYIDPKIHIKKDRKLTEKPLIVKATFNQGDANGRRVYLPSISRTKSVAGGTVSVTAGTNIITGVGTKFTSYEAGSKIEIGGEEHVIKSVASDLSMTSANNHAAGASAVPYYLLVDTGKWKISIGAEDITIDESFTYFIDSANATTYNTDLIDTPTNGDTALSGSAFMLDRTGGVWVSRGSAVPDNHFVSILKSDSGATDITRYIHFRRVRNLAADKDIYPPQHSTATRQYIYKEYYSPKLPWEPVLTSEFGTDPGEGGRIFIKENLDKTTREFILEAVPITRD